MPKIYPKCNVCGVPESEWVDGKCHCARSVCDMTPEVVVEQRVYDCAKRLGLLVGDTFYRNTIYDRMLRKSYKMPKYFRQAISREGVRYETLKDFPVGRVMMVCNDSDDDELQVGMLVWRDDPAKVPGNLDGLNFVKDAGSMDADHCEKALKGAMIEDTFMPIPQKE